MAVCVCCLSGVIKGRRGDDQTITLPKQLGKEVQAEIGTIFNAKIALMHGLLAAFAVYSQIVDQLYYNVRHQA